MPTPFLHLAMAEDVRQNDDLPPGVRCLLNQQRGPFLLGNTTPDVKTISGQARIDTHFYTLPRTSRQPAHRILFDIHPTLAHAEDLPSAQAAFIAGYITHLTLDEVWLDHIFVPYFWQQPDKHGEHILLHNALRTWLDQRAYARLPDDLKTVLRQTTPHHWLPFVKDNDLQAWRDWLTDQLGPGQRVQTAQVFARRMGIETSRIEALTASPTQMEARVFRRVPRSALHDFYTIGHTRSVAVLTQYLDHTAPTYHNCPPIITEVYA